MEEEKKDERMRVVLSDMKLGELDEDQLEIYRRVCSALSFAYGRDMSLPEARAKLDFLLELDEKRAELEEKCIDLREDALGSYKIAHKQLAKDPKHKATLQRGIDKLKELMDQHMEDPEKSVLKITFSDETRKLTAEEARESEVPEESTEFTGVRIVTVVLDSGIQRIF